MGPGDKRNSPLPSTRWQTSVPVTRFSPYQLPAPNSKT
jgi:hypothetical protein